MVGTQKASVTPSAAIVCRTGPGAKSRTITCRVPRAIPARAQASPPMWNSGMHTRLTSSGVKPQATEMSSSSTRRLVPLANIAPLGGPVVPLV